LVFHRSSGKSKLPEKKTFLYFRQKALKALNDRMKINEGNIEVWPQLEESHQIPLLVQTPNSSSVTIDMTNANELTPSITKDDSNQPYFDTEEQSK
jgi:hypothetical protein